MRLVATLVFTAIAATASAATSLEVVIPNNTTTGVPFNFTVTARNGSAVDPTYTGTIHFTSSDSTATLPSDYTFTPADAGSHQFSATMGRAGSGPDSAVHTITATDVANASINGIDATVVQWNANLVRWFFIKTPAAVDRTVPFSAEVRAYNVSGVLMTGYTGTIRFRATRGEQLPPDYTFTAADAGTHTFSITATRGDYAWFAVNDLADPTISGASNNVQVLCPELTVTASNSGPMCPAGAAVLFANANLPVTTYIWNSALGHPPLFTSYEQNPIVRMPGKYLLRVFQANDCSATSETVVTIHYPEGAQVSISASSLCGAETATATLNNHASFSNIEWRVHGGTILSGQGTPTIEFARSPGSTSVSLSIDLIENGSGCDASTWIGTLPAGEGNASAEISTVAAACPQTTQTASVPDNGTATYAWTITNGSITNGQGTRTIQYVPSGAGDVTLTASVTKDSCSSSDDAIVSVDGPTALVDAQLAPCGEGEADIPVTLTGVPPFRIVWSDGVVQDNITTLNATRTVTESGVYWITAVSDANCSGTASGQAEVFFGSAPEITSEPRNTTIASGQTATLTVAATGEELLYRWYEGISGDRSKLMSVEDDPSFTTPKLTRTTQYWVEVSNSCGDAESRTVIVSVGGGKRRSARH